MHFMWHHSHLFQNDINPLFLCTSCSGFDIFQTSRSGHTPKRVFSLPFYVSPCFSGCVPKVVTFQRICDSLLVIKKVSCQGRQTPRSCAAGRPVGRPWSQSPAEPLQVEMGPGQPATALALPLKSPCAFVPALRHVEAHSNCRVNSFCLQFTLKRC